MTIRKKETREVGAPPERLDAAIVGAGPYGLSAAAHLRARGLRVAVFGRTMELWQEHMPRGMLLRSRHQATNLSDPGGLYTFARFLRETGRGSVYPVPLPIFLEYARWFQRNAVPEVDETYVTLIQRHNHGFLLTLDDGRRVETSVVVMALGLSYYAHRPDEFRVLPPGMVSHSSELRDLNGFRNRRVVVVGGGQSAVEYAALLAEAGADVDLVARRPIVWLERDRYGERSLAERIRAPDAGIGPGWKNWILEHAPHLFYRLPRSWKERALVFYSGAWAADWLKSRIAGKVRLHEGRAIASSEVSDGVLQMILSDGVRIQADHLVLATGYRVDIQRLGMLSPGLRAAIQADDGVPILGPSFDASVPGLYFIGATSMRSFGPIFRFVLGCGAAARRVARSIARRQGESERSSPAPGRRPDERAVPHGGRKDDSRLPGHMSEETET